LREKEKIAQIKWCKNKNKFSIEAGVKKVKKKDGRKR
jgi:hypothetical protein